LLWEENGSNHEPFLNRLEMFLDACDTYGIGVGFVLLDAVWDPSCEFADNVRPPIPHLHNSGWIQSPGSEILFDLSRHDEMEDYIKGVVGRFANDPRIHYWDVFNEPENTNGNSYYEPAYKYDYSYALIQKVVPWVLSMNPTQPITSGPWLSTFQQPLNNVLYQYMFEHSDVVSFHSYSDIGTTRQCINNLRYYNRPLFITEYMARTIGSTFNPHLGVFKDEGVSAYSWGFVNGLTQTIYPWDSWQVNYTAPPPLWFHDILNPDGSAYIQDEVNYIRSLTLDKE